MRVHELDHDIKIALISQEFPPFTIGGIASVCYNLAYSLSKKGISTTVFCGKSNTITVENLNKYLKVVRLPLLDLPPRHVWFQLQNFRSLLELLKEFDVVHGVDTKASAFFAYFGKRLQKPFITHIHVCPHYETKAFLNSPISYWALGDFIYYVAESPMNGFLTKFSLAHSDRIVSCSFNTLKEVERKYPDLDYTKASVIYNGINFDKLSSGSGNPKEEDSIVFYGRLFYIKGILHLIKAISIVKKDFPNVVLDVFGKGSLEPKIRSLALKLGLEDNIHIHGYVSKRELIKKIRNASVVALPSLYEGQPVAVLEAMAYKKLVIVFDFPFTREFITDCYNGLLAKAGDIKDLADKINVSLSDKKLRLKLGQNAYEHIKKNHNWDILVKKYIELYNKIIH